jgi:ubiquinone/menaquinone biosynthesis C-methylase UbiE
LNNKTEVLEVSEKRWINAQEFESNLWVQNNQRNSYLKIILKFMRSMRNPKMLFNYLKFRDFYCGDDWNYWWMKQFENYKALSKPKYFERALEIGCGPFTNIRLVSNCCKIKEIYCCDPLMNVYTSFKLTWLSTQISKGRINISNDKCENLKFDNNYFDLVICINVLDHVQDAEECLNEMIRVTQMGGTIVLGQDLSNEDDLRDKIIREDMGHPIKIHHTTFDTFFDGTCVPLLRKVLPREEGRNPSAHYGTYIFIGQKK